MKYFANTAREIIVPANENWVAAYGSFFREYGKVCNTYEEAREYMLMYFEGELFIYKDAYGLGRFYLSEKRAYERFKQNY